MQLKSIVLMTVIVLLLIVSVCGCVTAPTTNTETPTPTDNTPGVSVPALEMVAQKQATPSEVTTYYGANVVTVNVTLTNHNAGTFKISTDDFYLQDSLNGVHQPLGTAVTAVSDSGYYNTMKINFQIKAGSKPDTVRYYDGTYDLSCAVM